MLSPSPDVQVGIAQHGDLLGLGAPQWQGKALAGVPRGEGCSSLFRQPQGCFWWGFSAAVKVEHPDVNAQVKRTWASRKTGNIKFKPVLGLCPFCSSCSVMNREKNLTLVSISQISVFPALSPFLIWGDRAQLHVLVHLCLPCPFLRIQDIWLNYFNWQIFCSNSSCGGNASRWEVLLVPLLPDPASPGHRAPAPNHNPCYPTCLSISSLPPPSLAGSILLE